jgi:hypothetical protein
MGAGRKAETNSNTQSMDSTLRSAFFIHSLSQPTNQAASRSVDCKNRVDEPTADILVTTNATLVSEPSSKLINCEQIRLFARDKDSVRDKDKEVSPKQIFAVRF